MTLPHTMDLPLYSTDSMLFDYATRNEYSAPNRASQPVELNTGAQSQRFSRSRGTEYAQNINLQIQPLFIYTYSLAN